ncbi:uncharacterized protein IWZ02DRAFT_488239 [Phyllosticta citriasiana]|uniref:uncharacterized protein n=1 Tax=Phyllosticta citriasiana TaxID=595635 RepID=UPI0030FDC44E
MDEPHVLPSISESEQQEDLPTYPNTVGSSPSLIQADVRDWKGSGTTPPSTGPTSTPPERAGDLAISQVDPQVPQTTEQGLPTAEGVIPVSQTTTAREQERRAARLRKTTSDPRYRSALATGQTNKQLWRSTVIRPTRMAIFSPVLVFICVYTALAYGILYILSQRSLIGLAAVGKASDGILRRKMAAGIAIRSEDRLDLRITVPTSLLLPAGVFLYGWSADQKVQWIFPMIGTTVANMGMIVVFICIQTYLVDAFTRYAASANAANTVDAEMAPPSASSLLSLPRELRDIIYTHVFSDPVGLRYEYGTGRLIPASIGCSTPSGSPSAKPLSPHESGGNHDNETPTEEGQNFWAIRCVNRQLRNETAFLPLSSNAVVFDNLHLSTRGRIPRPNYRKYFNRWDTEFSEEPASPRDDMVAKPIAARVRSFLSRTSPAQRARLRRMAVVELRPLGHVGALYDVLDEFGVGLGGGGGGSSSGVELSLVIVPSVIGTFEFERHFVTQMRRCLVAKWFMQSRHRVRFELDEGFDGLEDWIRCEFPTQVSDVLQRFLVAQVRVLRLLAGCLDGKQVDEGKLAAIEAADDF